MDAAGSRLNLWARLLGLLTLTLALAGPGGYRLALFPLRVGLLLPVLAVLTGLLALAAALWLLLRRRSMPGATTSALFATVTAAPVVAFVGWNAFSGMQAPPIHDISTDLDAPPEFRVIGELRPVHANDLERDPETDRRQRQAYPQIDPLTLPLPTAAVYALALDLVKDRGWQLQAADNQRYRIEATARTFWYGFEDDVVIRLTPTADGTRVDMRSVSRLGRSDLGKNAARIRSFLDDLRREARSSSAPDRRPADGVVGKAEIGQHLGIIEIAAIKDHRR